MMLTRQQMQSNYRSMPDVLQGLTMVFLIFSLFLPAGLIPGGTHMIGEDIVTFGEFWRQGAGPAFCAVGLISPIIALGFLHKQTWARAAPFLILCGLLILPPFDQSMDVLAHDIASGLFTLAVIAWYFFYKPSVRGYFAADGTGEPSPP